jgi:hypothetical protein
LEEIYTIAGFQMPSQPPRPHKGHRTRSFNQEHWDEPLGPISRPPEVRMHGVETEELYQRTRKRLNDEASGACRCECYDVGGYQMPSHLPYGQKCRARSLCGQDRNDRLVGWISGIDNVRTHRSRKDRLWQALKDRKSTFTYEKLVDEHKKDGWFGEKKEQEPLRLLYAYSFRDDVKVSRNRRSLKEAMTQRTLLEESLRQERIEEARASGLNPEAESFIPAGAVEEHQPAKKKKGPKKPKKKLVAEEEAMVEADTEVRAETDMRADAGMKVDTGLSA